MGAQLTRGIFLSLGQCRTWLYTLTPTVFHGKACFLFTFGIIKPRLWWDSNPQPLNHCATCLTRSPMRYPLRHRACRTYEFSVTCDSTSWPRTLPTERIPELILTIVTLSHVRFPICYRQNSRQYICILIGHNILGSNVSLNWLLLILGVNTSCDWPRNSMF